MEGEEMGGREGGRERERELKNFNVHIIYLTQHMHT